MRGLCGKPGWFWLFLIEGTITFLVGFLVYPNRRFDRLLADDSQSILYLPESPLRTSSIIHRRSWYTAREETILVNRLVRDDPSKTSCDHRQTPTVRTIWAALRDYYLYPLHLVGFMALIPVLPIKLYLHLTLRRLGFTTFKSNMLAIPAATIQIPTVLCLAWSSSHFNERTWHCVLALLYTIPLLTALECLPRSAHIHSAPSGSSAGTAGSYIWPRYTLATLLSGAPSPYPILLSWLSATCPSTHLRGTSVAIFTTLNLAGAVVASQVYQKADEPDYKVGNAVLIGVAGATCLVLVGQWAWFRRMNEARERRREGMVAEEIEMERDRAWWGNAGGGSPWEMDQGRRDGRQRGNDGNGDGESYDRADFEFLT